MGLWSSTFSLSLNSSHCHFFFFYTPFKPILEKAEMIFFRNRKGCLNKFKPPALGYFTKQGKKKGPLLGPSEPDTVYQFTAIAVEK